MKKTTLVGVTALLLCVANGMEARAQRTMRGESLISIESHYPFSNPYWMGVDISYGQYLLNSYWKAGVTGTEYSHQITEKIPMGYMHIAAYGEWMYRLVGTRNRALNLYGGAGAFLGYEAIDTWGLLPDTVKTDYASGYFLYGVNLSLELEIFFSRRAAFLLCGGLPINFSSQFKKVHTHAGAGLRFNF